MALPRVVFIEDEKVLDQSGSVTIDINVVEPITALEIRVKATNGTTSNQANHLHDLFTTIELVDGSDVLYSLAMVKGQALNFYEMGRTPLMNLTEFANDGARESVWINFGRNLWDKEHAFLPTKFRNPQLKLTWNLDAVRDSDTTGFVDGTGRLTVIAHILPSAQAARGFLMAKDIYSYTSGGSGDERIELPYDYPYRFMLVRSYEAGNDFRENINNIKLSVDQDAIIPFNLDVLQFQELCRDWFGPHTVGTKIFRTHLDVINIHTNELDGLTFCSDDAYSAFGINYAWSSNVGLWVWSLDGAAVESVDCEARMTEWGYTFHNALCYPFGNPKDPATWFDPKPYRSVRLILTQAQTGAAVSTILQQLRRY